MNGLPSFGLIATVRAGIRVEGHVLHTIRVPPVLVVGSIGLAGSSLPEVVLVLPADGVDDDGTQDCLRIVHSLARQALAGRPAGLQPGRAYHVDGHDDFHVEPCPENPYVEFSLRITRHLYGPTVTALLASYIDQDPS